MWICVFLKIGDFGLKDISIIIGKSDHIEVKIPNYFFLQKVW